jgi:hypothetical protein
MKVWIEQRLRFSRNFQQIYLPQRNEATREKTECLGDFVAFFL